MSKVAWTKYADTSNNSWFSFRAITLLVDVTFLSMNQFDQNGWLLFDSIYSEQQLARLRMAVSCLEEELLNDKEQDSIRHRAGTVYAARNVLELIPEIISLWQCPELLSFLARTLGDKVGLVRALYFDKPPEQTWALPWHKDLLIAVANGTEPTPGYSKPRPRAGILHTEPPVEVLQRMVTLRIHLDEMTLENGPLEVLTGSHKTGIKLVIDGFQRQVITSSAGSVFAMSPLLVHASGRSLPEVKTHRRVLHLEFAGSSKLPNGVHWNTYEMVRGKADSDKAD